jgi:hypothetical protein
MKKMTLLLMAVFTIVSATLTAQISISTGSNNSKLKTGRNIYVSSFHPTVAHVPYGNRGYLGNDLMRSQKEKMKMQVVKTYICPVHSNVVSEKPGRCPQCGTLMNRSSKERMKMEVMKTYTCPMHPEVSANAAGKCPKCGMALRESPKPAVSHSCGMHAGVTGNKPGKCTDCGNDFMRSPKEKMKMEVMKQYCCPMSATDTYGKPSKSSCCRI